MNDLDLVLNPITKLEIYRACKNTIFMQMDNNQITSERADEILAYIKQKVVNIDTPEQAKFFCSHIVGTYSELNNVKYKFESETKEKFDNFLAFLLGKIIKKDIDSAVNIMEQMKNQDYDILCEKLKNEYPDEFASVLLEVSGK